MQGAWSTEHHVAARWHVFYPMPGWTEHAQKITPALKLEITPQVQNMMKRLRMELKLYEVSESRFIDRRYNMLFKIPDGESVVLRAFDGTSRVYLLQVTNSESSRYIFASRIYWFYFRRKL